MFQILHNLLFIVILVASRFFFNFFDFVFFLFHFKQTIVVTHSAGPIYSAYYGGHIVSSDIEIVQIGDTGGNDDFLPGRLHKERFNFNNFNSWIKT